MTKQEYKEQNRKERFENYDLNPNFGNQLKKLIEDNFTNEIVCKCIDTIIVEFKVINTRHRPDLKYGSILISRGVDFRNKRFGTLEFERLQLVSITLNGQYIEFKDDDIIT